VLCAQRVITMMSDFAIQPTLLLDDDRHRRPPRFASRILGLLCVKNGAGLVDPVYMNVVVTTEFKNRMQWAYSGSPKLLRPLKIIAPEY
jgi:hypothetical protein